MSEPRWKLDELAEQSRSFLHSEGDSNRVQWKPNGRQIRYYGTLGLLDKPFGSRGQGATYGPKHLLQLVAVKRLQHQGLKLAEIQSVLSGLSSERLRELLGFSPDWLDHLPEEEEPEPRDQTDFWTEIPPAPPPPVPSRETLHLELAPGVEFVVLAEHAEHLSQRRVQELGQELRSVWKGYRK